MAAETILVLDDDRLVLSATLRLLERLGYTALAAPSGDEAIALLKAHPGKVHLLLADANLPGISGVAVARQAQALQPGLKLLLMSGGNNASSLAFLEKPFAGRELERAIRAALDTPP